MTSLLGHRWQGSLLPKRDRMHAVLDPEGLLKRAHQLRFCRLGCREDFVRLGELERTEIDSDLDENVRLAIT